MGRQTVNLAIDTELLKSIVKEKETWTERAQKYGVTKQAVSGWLTSGRIPPRALVEIVRDLDLTPEQVEAILAPQKEKAEERKKWKITVYVEEP